MVIYKTTNLINGKIYIGQTINNRKNYLGSGNIIKYAIKKYGKENFKKEIIDTAQNIEELNQKEEYWINYHNSIYPNGYNLQTGGKSNGAHLDISKEKISTANKGKIRTDEVKNKISKSLKGNTFHKNKSMSIEAKLKISEKQKGKKYSNTHRNRISEGLKKCRVVCPYCNREGQVSSMKRWHFENCKLNTLKVL